MPYIEPTIKVTESIIKDELNVSEGQEAISDYDCNDTHTEQGI